MSGSPSRARTAMEAVLPQIPQGRSLSRFLCKLICEWSGEVGVEAVGVGQGERAEGGFPAVHGASFDESALGGAPVGC